MLPARGAVVAQAPDQVSTPDDVDTFRIKIWREMGAGESVVYDNWDTKSASGHGQAIVGGNIKVVVGGNAQR